MLGNKLLQSTLDLCMAVGAEQNALGGFGAKRIQSHRVGTASAERERLLAGIAVMEMKSGDAAVVATELATPARLLDQEALDALTPARHRLGRAAGAAPSPVSPEHAHGRPVPDADSDALGLASALGMAGGCGRSKAVSLQPVADRRRASVDLGGDPADAHVARHEFGEP